MHFIKRNQNDCIPLKKTKLGSSKKSPVNVRGCEFHLNLCLPLTTLLPGSDKVRPTKSMNESHENGPCWRIFKINMGLIRTDFVDDLFIEFPGRPLCCESSLCIALADSRPAEAMFIWQHSNVYLVTRFKSVFLMTNQGKRMLFWTPLTPKSKLYWSGVGNKRA